MKSKIILTLLVVTVAVVGVYRKFQNSKSPEVAALKAVDSQTRTLASETTASPSKTATADSTEETSGIDEGFEEVLGEVKEGIANFHKCQQEGACVLDETDSRSGEFQNVRELQQKLMSLNRQVRERGWSARELSELARELLNFDDGAIKEEALNLLLSQQAEPENVEAIAKGVFEYHDSNLVDQAIAEYQRHLNGSQAVLVHQSIRQCLLTGSLFVREGLSANLGKFINQGSYQFYQELSQDPGIEGVIRRNLQSTLMEYQLNQSGG